MVELSILDEIVQILTIGFRAAAEQILFTGWPLVYNQGGWPGVNGNTTETFTMPLSLTEPIALISCISGTGATASATPFLFSEFVEASPTTEFKARNTYPNRFSFFFLVAFGK